MRRCAKTKTFFRTSVLIASISFLPQVARAQNSPPPHREHVRFSYRAPEGCPFESDFLEAVRERNAEIISDGQAARALSISIAPDGDKWRGSLHTEGIANGEATRTAVGDSCEHVARSLAIFTAIALREGSPDELPPAHPELAEKESLETPEEGFLPIAQPLRPGPPVLDLYRGRFALTASESFTLINDGGQSFATNIGAAYFSSNVFGIGIEGAFHVNRPGGEAGDGPADFVVAHGLGYMEFVWMRAKAATFERDRGRTIDLFSRFGGGLMWARPQPEISSDFPNHPYAAGGYFQESLGVRVFLSNDIALVLQTHLDFYEQRNSDETETTAVGGGIQIGVTWFPSKANRW